MYRFFIFNGDLAVAIFFVVSGISLSIGYLTTQDGEKLTKLAIGRYFRLAIPITGACLLAWLAAISGLTTSAFHAENAKSLTAVLRFALFDCFASSSVTHSPIPPLWTMPIELGGSVVVIFLLAFARFSTRLVAYTAAGLVLWFYQPLVSAFVIGMLVAEYSARHNRGETNKPFFALGCIAGAVIAGSFLPGAPFTRCVAVAAVLVVGIANSTAARRFLVHPVSQWLGRISFTLYLLHALVIYSFGTRLQAHMPQGSAAFTALADIAIIAVCLGVATAFSFIDRIGVSASRVIAAYSTSVARKQFASTA